ncbi:MAG: sigma-70 family RNA polymerase sigma factor [Acidobacteria bacterium]|nr:sigma-70 family RNA polymerase sigma factor [Acidobacteriota bacterium]
MALDPPIHDPEDFLTRNLPQVERVIRWVGRRRGLPADELEEFRSRVLVRLVENDYDVLRKFRGLSSVQTFLVTVIQRLLLDYIAQEQGRWRPSAAALKRGALAVELEKLMVRGRRTFEEAFAALRARHGESLDRDELFRLAAELPLRRMTTLVPLELVENLAARSQSAEKELGRIRHVEQSARLSAALRDALADLPAEDRLLIRLRYVDGLTVAQLARSFGGNQVALYRRFEKIQEQLRRLLVRRRMVRESVDEMLGCADARKSLNFFDDAVADRGDAGGGEDPGEKPG